MEDIELASHPHDAYFKEVFSDPRTATVFFQHHLPAPVAAKMDWPTLQLVPGSFVKQSLEQSHSDLLFSIQAKGTPCLLYLLFEHQTTIERLMPLRLLGYMMEILNGHAESHGLPLPPVLPLVLHQGPDRWTVSPAFEDLFSLTPELADAFLPCLPKFRHALLDLSQFDPKNEEADEQLRFVLYLMKLARTQQLSKFFAWLMLQAAVPGDLLRKSLLYALHAEPVLDLEEIDRTLHHHPHLKEEIMSTAAVLKAEGRAEGKAEGELRGRMVGKLTCLQELMGLRVSIDEELANVDVAELERRYKDLQRQYEAQFKRP